MDPKVKPPTRIVVSGGPKVEPRLHMATKQDRYAGLKLLIGACIVVFAVWLLLALFFTYGQVPT